MKKVNCWEATNCGRQAGGSKIDDLGICPASEETAVNGMNNGINGGRVCWALTGTLCGGKVQYFETQKWSDCRRCTFFWKVHWEEGAGYSSVGDIMERLFFNSRPSKPMDPRITAYLIG